MRDDLEALLRHPLIVLALAVWALNDHVLKGAFGNGWTGKLSDAASLIVSPVLLAYALDTCGVLRTRHTLLLALSAFTMAIVMAAIKLWPAASEVYRVGLGLAQWPFRCLLTARFCTPVPVYLADDPSDVWTTPAVLVPLFLGIAGRFTFDAPLPHGAHASARGKHGREGPH